MTILVSVHCNDYILIAADKRLIKVSDNESRDDIKKITETSSVTITGTGNNALLHPVKSAFNNELPLTLDEMLKIIKREQLKFEIKYNKFTKKTSNYKNKSSLEIIEGTSFIISYLDQKEDHLRLIYIENEDTINKVYEIKKGNTKITIPINVDYESFEREKNTLKSKISYKEHYLSSNINKKEIGVFIETISKITNSVSSNIDIVIITKENYRIL